MATMLEMEPQLSLGEALTELERLIVVWEDLIATGVASSSIVDLVNNSIRDLDLRYRPASTLVSIDTMIPSDVS